MPTTASANESPQQSALPSAGAPTFKPKIKRVRVVLKGGLYAVQSRRLGIWRTCGEYLDIDRARSVANVLALDGTVVWDTKDA